MAIGTGDTVRKYATPITLEAAGGAISNGSILAADDATYDLTASGYEDCPHALFTISVAAGTAFDNNGIIRLIIQSLDVDGSGVNEPDPSSSYWPRTSGILQVKSQTARQYAEVACYNIPRKGKLWLLNNAGQTISGTNPNEWTAKMTPFTFGPAP